MASRQHDSSLGDTSSIRALNDALRDPSPDVRLDAAQRLSAFDPGRRPPGASEMHRLTTDALVAMLEDDDAAVRAAATRTLAGYSDARAYLAVRSVAASATTTTEDLVALLRDAPAALAATAAAELGRRRAPAAVAPLIEALRSRDLGLRRAATAALAEIGDEEAVAALVEAVLDERPSQDDELFCVLDPTGASDGMPEALAQYGRQGAVALLDAARRRDDLGDRAEARAAAVLRQLGPAALDVVLASLGADEDVVRRVAARAVEEETGPAVVEALRRLTDAKPAATRLAGVDALRRVLPRQAGSLQGDAAIASLFERLHDPARSVRLAARRTLGELAATSPAVVAGTGPLLRDDPDTARPLVVAMAGAPGVDEILAKALADGSPETRLHAAAAVRDAAPWLAWHAPRALRRAVQAVCEEATDPMLRRVADETLAALNAARTPVPAIDADAEATHGIVAARAARQQRHVSVRLHTDTRSPEPLPEGEPITQGTSYLLEAAVSVGIEGVPWRDTPRALPELAAGADGHVRLLVAAASDDINIEDGVSLLLLPPAGPSLESAWFRIQPRRLAGEEDPARIELRLYRDWNLVAAYVLEACVLPRFGDAVTPRTPVWLRARRTERLLPELPDVTPRAMHIDVARAGDRYELRFGRTVNGEDVVLRARTPVSADELESELLTVRELWREVALETPFVNTIEIDPADAQEQLRRLAEAGRRLWSMLFRRRMAGGLSEIGSLLARWPLPPGATIQVSVEEDASSFVFPWALLFDGPRPRTGEPVALDGFWGLRHVLEQGVPRLRRAPDRARDRPADAALRLAYMLWRHFRNAREHSAMLERLVEVTAGRLQVTAPPILDADTCLDVLQAGDDDVLYFYTHGFTRRRGAATRAEEELARIVQRYEALAATDPRRETLKLLYEALLDGAAGDRSFIQFHMNRLYLDDLELEIDRLDRRPLVILNMCESAQVTPSLSDSFVSFFLDRGASSVVGTECPMTVSFAHPFAEALLTGVLRGAPVGAALLDLRRRFMLEHANPLGLAYSLYGSATTQLLPPCLPEAAHERSPA